MQSKKLDIISESIQEMEYIEDKLLNKKEKFIKKLNKKVRICPHSNSFEHQIYKELKEVIICNDLEVVSIKRWDELEIDFNDQNTRYSQDLKQNIIKVTNQYNYDLVKNDAVCISIPYNGILQKSLDEEIQEYIKQYVFIQISRRLIQTSGYRDEEDIKDNNMQSIIEYILSYIENDIENSSWKDMKSWVKSYQEFRVDLGEIIKKNKR